jgi:hypothetical protein
VGCWGRVDTWGPVAFDAMLSLRACALSQQHGSSVVLQLGAPSPSWLDDQHLLHCNSPTLPRPSSQAAYPLCISLALLCWLEHHLQNTPPTPHYLCVSLQVVVMPPWGCAPPVATSGAPVWWALLSSQATGTGTHSGAWGGGRGDGVKGFDCVSCRVLECPDVHGMGAMEGAQRRMWVEAAGVGSGW